MLIGAFSQYFFGFTIFILSTFLILLVLVQRGRGGGLTGALGGPGGQSAFGTKAGDLFTRITVGVAAVWILLCATAVFVLKEAALPETRVGALPTLTSDSADTPASGTSSSGLPGLDGLKLPTGGTGSTLPATGSGSTTGGANTTPAAITPAVTTETKPTADTPSPTTPAADTPATTTPSVTEPAKPAEPKVDAPASPAPSEGTSPGTGNDK